MACQAGITFKSCNFFVFDVKISSHLGRAWFLLYDCLVMLEPYYACCKHGPDHTRRRGCGFVHTLSDLRMPIMPPPRVWRDRTHERSGPAGIDWFLGQAYTVSQSRRLLRYLTHEPVSRMPPWARRLCWPFFGPSLCGHSV